MISELERPRICTLSRLSRPTPLPLEFMQTKTENEIKILGNELTLCYTQVLNSSTLLLQSSIINHSFYKELLTESTAKVKDREILYTFHIRTSKL